MIAKASDCFAISPSDANQLERLARDRFGELTECEKRVVENAATGDVAYCGRNHNDHDPVPSARGTETKPYDLRTALVRWLSIDPVAAKLVDAKGIRLQGARLKDPLDLSNATVTFPLSFTNSLFQKLIDLGGAQLAGLYLKGSHLVGISAGDVTARTDIDLSDAISMGGVDINDAKVGGDLICSGGKFKNRGDVAINAEGLKVDGRVYFQKPFSSEGAVELRGASIGGDLYCEGGKFSNRNGDALSGDTLKARNIFLDNISALGTVHFNDAQIDGVLYATGGTFDNSKANALIADRIKVHGGVFLNKPFKATGRVSLSGADLGGDLFCSGGEFSNSNGVALIADDLKARNVYLNSTFKAEGEVDLLDAELGGILDATGGTFDNSKADALIADRIKVHGDVLLVKPFKGTGRVSLSGAELGGDLFCDGGEFANSHGDALNADDLKARNAYLRSGFKATGRVGTGAV